MSRFLVFLPAVVLACSSSDAGSSSNASGDKGTGAEESRGDGGPGSGGGDGGGGTASGDVPEVAVTALCAKDELIDYRDYGAKDSVIGTWDLSKACVQDFVEYWTAAYQPTHTVKTIAGKARARWVFTDKTVQRTVSWAVDETADIQKYDVEKSCDENAALYDTILDKESPYHFEQPATACRASGKADYCTCDFHFASHNADGEPFTDAAPVGYLLSSRGVTTGDTKLDFKSDTTALVTDGQGLVMTLTKTN